MKVGITACIREIDINGVHVNCEIQQRMAVSALMPFAFEAMLKAMRDTDIDAFHTAMINFTEDEMRNFMRSKHEDG